MEKIKSFESFEYDSELNEAKFARNTPDVVKKRKLKAQLSKLSGKERKDYIKNMWPEDRKLLNLGKGIEKKEVEEKEILADIKAKLHPIEWKFLLKTLEEAQKKYPKATMDTVLSIINGK